MKPINAPSIKPRDILPREMKTTIPNRNSSEEIFIFLLLVSKLNTVGADKMKITAGSHNPCEITTCHEPTLVGIKIRILKKIEMCYFYLYLLRTKAEKISRQNV